MSHNRITQRRRMRLGVALVLALVAAFLAAWAAWTTVAGISREASLGRDEMVAGARILASAGLGTASQQTGLARSDFRSAGVHFSNVNRAVSNSLILQLIGGLPWIKEQVRAIDSLSEMGVHVSRAGELGVQVLELALADHQSGPPVGQAPGQQFLSTLRLIDPLLGKISPEVVQAAAARQQIPSSGLLPPLSNAVRQFDARLDIVSVGREVASFRSQEPAIYRLLGSSGPQTYLVLEQDPAELRATGGLIGSIAFLSFDHGQIAPLEPIDIGNVDVSPSGQTFGFGKASTGVPVPRPLGDAFNLTSLALRDANWWPDFPTSARMAEFLLQRETGRKVDGVIAIDPHLMEHVLQVTGPIKVPETGDIVDSNNFFATTLNRVELNLSANHKTFLGAAAKAILPKLFSIPRSQWIAMFRVLRWGCDARSLQAYFDAADLQGLAKTANCSGQLEASKGDQLLVADCNIGGNKDDFWLQRRFSLQIAMRPDGSASHNLQIHYSGLEPHDIHLTQYRGYLGWLRVYVPPSATLVSSSGADLKEATELGLRVFEGTVFVPFYHTLDVNLKYTVGSLAMRSSADSTSFFWQKQAGRVADGISISFIPPAGSKLKDAFMGTSRVRLQNATTDLSVDRSFTFDYGST